MRDVVIEGGDVVTESGVLRGHSILVRDGIIAEVGLMHGHPDAIVIDARGSVVLPGTVNAHAHGCTTGPLFSSGAEALSSSRARANLDRHLAAGLDRERCVHMLSDSFDGRLNTPVEKDARVILPCEGRCCT